MFKRPQVGLDIGSSTIKLVGLQQSKKIKEVLFCHLVDLVEKYRIKKREELSDEMYIDTLRDLRNQFSLNKMKIHCVINPDIIILRCLELPQMARDDLEKAIKWELMDILTDDIESFEIDHQIFPSAGDSNGRCEVMVGAVSRSEIERYLHISREANLRVQILDLEATSIYNAFQVLVPPIPDQVIGVISIGARHTICIVSQGGKPPFFHISPLGGDDISRALMEEWHLSFGRADFIKKHYGKGWVSHVDVVLLGLQKQFDNIRVRIRSILDSFVTEIDRSLKHFQACENISTIDRLYLTGGGAKLKNLDKIFAHKLGIPTMFWNPMNSNCLVTTQIPESIREQVGTHMAGCVGTVLREASNVDSI